MEIIELINVNFVMVDVLLVNLIQLIALNVGNIII